MATRIYTQDTIVVREALALVPKLTGLPETASASQRMQAMAGLVVERAHEDETREAKLRAYEAMAADVERSERIRRNTDARIAAGLL
jgi:hypothetical protein